VFDEQSRFLAIAYDRILLQACSKWFQGTFDGSLPAELLNVLVFSCTSGRPADRMLQPIIDLHRQHPFTHVIFTTVTPYQTKPKDASPGLYIVVAAWLESLSV
jgi:hypothetical protein